MYYCRRNRRVHVGKLIYRYAAAGLRSVAVSTRSKWKMETYLQNIVCRILLIN